VLANSRQAGSAATGIELKKQRKYQYISVGVDFIPVAIETSDIWGQQTMELSWRSDVELLMSAMNHGHNSFCISKSLAVQRGNAACINGTLQANYFT